MSSDHHVDDVCVVTIDRVASMALKCELDAMGIKGKYVKCMVGMLYVFTEGGRHAGSGVMTSMHPQRERV
jgi:hypothetical protein